MAADGLLLARAEVDPMKPISSRLSPVTQEKALRDVPWVAEFLGVSRSWVYQACSDGTLPHLRIGAQLRFDPVRLRAWLEAEKVSPPSYSGRSSGGR